MGARSSSAADAAAPSCVDCLDGNAKRLVTVLAPGAGLASNRAAYDQLRGSGFRLHVEGRAGDRYDAYPPTWQGGRPAPNLLSWAESVSSTGLPESSDCLVLGSRGGQVVLPALWGKHGDAIAPAVVINGGCALGSLPTQSWRQWPRGAVTFLLMGGEDYFRGRMSHEEYVSDAMGSVPRANASTAILYVDQMKHMPQPQLLQAVLKPMIQAVLEWHDSDKVPSARLGAVLEAVRSGLWSGRLLHKEGEGDQWCEAAFGGGRSAPGTLRQVPCRAAAGAAAPQRVPQPQPPPPEQLSKQQPPPERAAPAPAGANAQAGFAAIHTPRVLHQAIGPYAVGAQGPGRRPATPQFADLGASRGRSYTGCQPAVQVRVAARSPLFVRPVPR